MDQQTKEYRGQRQEQTTLDPNIAMQFFVQQMLNNVQTVCLVRVEGVTNDGGLEPVGMVNVKPLVQQMTGEREAVDHGIIYNIPYLRLQGGTDAIIIDPKVDDIGICVFCSRDSSIVKKTLKEAPPGSYRVFNWADGLYLGGVLNGLPQQYIQFSESGIKIHSPTKIILEAPDIEFIGAVTASSTIEVAGEVTSEVDVKAGEISLATHVHGGVAPGGSNTGEPV